MFNRNTFNIERERLRKKPHLRKILAYMGPGIPSEWRWEMTWCKPSGSKIRTSWNATRENAWYNAKHIWEVFYE